MEADRHAQTHSGRSLLFRETGKKNGLTWQEYVRARVSAAGPRARWGVEALARVECGDPLYFASGPGDVPLRSAPSPLTSDGGFGP